MNRTASGRAPDLEEGGETEIEQRQSWRQWVLNSPVIRLQVSITLILTVILTLMTVVIWKQMSDTLYNQVNFHSLLVRKNLLTSVYERFHTHIRIAAEDNVLVASRFHAQKFADMNENNTRFNDEVRLLLWPRFRIKTQYQGFFFTRDVDGATAGYSRKGNESVFFSTMGAGNFTIDMYRVDNQTGESLSAYPSIGTLDLREGLREVMQYPNLNTSLKLLQWGSYVFLYFSTKVTEETLVDASTNLNSTRGINGTLQATYGLEELSEFMSTFDFLGGGMFAMTEDGRLIANSDKTPPYKIKPGSNEKVLIRASEMNNTVLAGAAHWHETQKLKKFPVYASNVKIGGSRYYVDTSTVNLTLMNMEEGTMFLVFSSSALDQLAKVPGRGNPESEYHGGG